MRRGAYAGRSWPILRGMSPVPFSPHSTCWHGRTLESEVISQRVAGVCRAEQGAPCSGTPQAPSGNNSGTIFW